MKLLAALFALAFSPAALSQGSNMQDAQIEAQVQDVIQALSEIQFDKANQLMIDYFKGATFLDIQSMYRRLPFRIYNSRLSKGVIFWFLKRFVMHSPGTLARNRDKEIILNSSGQSVYYPNSVDYFIKEMNPEMREEIFDLYLEEERYPKSSPWIKLWILTRGNSTDTRAKITNGNYYGSEHSIIREYIESGFAGEHWYQIPELIPSVASYIAWELSSYSLSSSSYSRVLNSDLPKLKVINNGAADEFMSYIKSVPDPYLRLDRILSEIRHTERLVREEKINKEIIKIGDNLREAIRQRPKPRLWSFK